MLPSSFKFLVDVLTFPCQQNILYSKAGQREDDFPTIYVGYLKLRNKFRGKSQKLIQKRMFPFSPSSSSFFFLFFFSYSTSIVSTVHVGPWPPSGSVSRRLYLSSFFSRF